MKKMKKMKKIFVINFAGQNIGDDELLKIGVERVANEGFDVIIGCEVNRQTKKLFKNTKLVNVFNIFDVIKVMRKVDGVFISGGGSISYNVYFDTIVYVAKLFKKKVVWFGVGASHSTYQTGIRHHFRMFISTLALKLSDGIYVRDIGSKIILKNIGVSSRLSYDLAYLYNAKKIKPKRKNVGIHVRKHHTSHKHITKKWDKIFQQEILNDIKKLVKSDTKKYKFSLLASTKADYNLAKSLELNVPIVFPDLTTTMIKEFSVIITMRKHPFVFASMNGTNSIYIDIHRQGYALFSQLFDDDLCIRYVNVESKFDYLSQLLDRAENEDTHKLFSRIENIKSHCEESFNDAMRNFK